MIRTLTAALMASTLAAPLLADAVPFEVDASHAQIVFSYNHLGFSTTHGMFSGFEGEIMFDEDAPENSSVSVSMPVSMMFTGWEQRDQHFMSADFFNASAQADAGNDMVTFTSTSIEITGENTANITGDLTMNGITNEVVLATTLNQSQPYPFGPKEGTPTLGFDATTTLSREAFGVGAFAPAVSDAVEVTISLEALQAS